MAKFDKPSTGSTNLLGVGTTGSHTGVVVRGASMGLTSSISLPKHIDMAISEIVPHIPAIKDCCVNFQTRNNVSKSLGKAIVQFLSDEKKTKELKSDFLKNFKIVYEYMTDPTRNSFSPDKNRENTLQGMTEMIDSFQKQPNDVVIYAEVMEVVDKPITPLTATIVAYTPPPETKITVVASTPIPVPVVPVNALPVVAQKPVAVQSAVQAQLGTQISYGISPISTHTIPEISPIMTVLTQKGGYLDTIVGDGLRNVDINKLYNDSATMSALLLVIQTEYARIMSEINNIQSSQSKVLVDVSSYKTLLTNLFMPSMTLAQYNSIVGQIVSLYMTIRQKSKNINGLVPALEGIVHEPYISQNYGDFYWPDQNNLCKMIEDQYPFPNKSTSSTAVPATTSSRKFEFSWLGLTLKFDRK